MANTTTQITGDSKELVAFELMKFICDKVATKDTAERIGDPKAYYFKLYGECLAAVSDKKSGA